MGGCRKNYGAKSNPIRARPKGGGPVYVGHEKMGYGKKISNLCGPAWCDRILELKIFHYERRDQLVLTAEENDNFSTKSAYTPICRATFNPKKEVWKELWEFPIHERLKFFLWRIGVDGLPTPNKMAKGMPNYDQNYKACDKETETITHLLIHYDIARCFWFAVGHGNQWTPATQHGEKLVLELLSRNR